ncbi:hypothetical protein [Chlamydia psittaci]|uniref:hypothetical protein n=1 Tax=Chlamydia psittaci TaxID=83554 RepID=UPI00027E5044|nr:hypothetical protein [Chlamydia psittaci]AFS28057.1 putative inner membrane protein [Chlamydia psittaci NJ1]KPZ38242.1 membrane protein [Chlamydia psittaci NJ1]MDS0920072.1 hypothetical protein [Chlamydia psittaci]MDS0990020.1 hypothetical protein [Chlamydia psittaci]MDS0995994.1 hypothetical protein [Chlamydia psittaci]
MSCFNLSSVNQRLAPVGPNHFPDETDWKNVFESKIMKSSRSHLELEKYQANRQTRVAVIALSVLVTLVLLAMLLGTLQIQAFVMTWVAVVVAVAVPTILLTGGMYVLYRISRKVDVLAGSVIKPFGNRVWAPMPLCHYYKPKAEEKERIQERIQETHIDLSTLDKNGSGVALVYFYPDGIDYRIPTFVFPLIAAPFVVLIKMVYNLIRFIVIPFYILLQMVIQCVSKTDISKEDRFIFKDIVREMARSLVNLVKAPFYGTASMMAVFYGLLNPLGGRVAYSCIERDWNNDVIRSRGVWLAVPQHNFKFEGGGTRQGLGQFSYYLIGCFQPIGMFLFREGKIVSGAHTSVQYYPQENLPIYPGIAVIPASEIEESNHDEELGSANDVESEELV